MSIFSNSIGQMMTNEEDDVFKAKEIFQDIGLYKDDPENGILDQGLDDALKLFQKDRGLKIDGILHPDGETEQVLTRELVQKQKKEKEPLNGIIPPQRKPKNPLLVLKETLEKSRPNSQKKSPLETLLGNLETLSPPDVIKNVQEKQTPKPEEKPAPVDATGRMIREKSPPVPKKKPEVEKKQKEPKEQGMPDNFDEIADFIKKQEDSVDHLYKDTRGNVTVGVGHLITNVEEAKKLPFYVHDKNDAPVRPATQKEIETLYRQVTHIPHGQSVGSSVYDPQKKTKMKNIKLREQDINTLFKKDLEQHTKELKQKWNGVENLPAQVQKGMLDIHFNIGGSKFTPEKWPNLKKAIDEKDWNKVANEMHRKTTHESRNKKVQEIIRSITKKQKDNHD